MSENTPPTHQHSTPGGPTPPPGYQQPPGYQNQPGYHQHPPAYQQPPLQPGAPPAVQPMLESEARNWAMLVHLIAVGALLISGGMLGFVAPLVVWLMFRERSALVDYHGKQNLNLQITLIVVAFAAIVLSFVTFGVGMFLTIPLALAYGIYAIVISIVAGLKANNGEYYRIGLAIRFIR